MRQENERAHRLVGEIDQRKAVGQRNQYRTTAGRRGRPHHRVKTDRTVLTALDDVQLAAFDVDPEQAPSCGIPAWPFRELRVCADGDFHGLRFA